MAADDIALVDAICDEFEVAIQRGEVDPHDASSFLSSWTARVDPELRPWLEEELRGIAADFADGELSGAGTETAIDADAWIAIIDCETFRPLSREAKLSIASAIERREFSEGEHVLKAGQPSAGLLLVTSGKFRVIGDNEAGRHEIDQDGRGSVLGEMSLLSGYPCGADVVATSKIKALVLTPEAYAAVKREHPEIEIALSELVSERLGHRLHDSLSGKTLEGYRLGACLGTGAMGVVYAADHVETKSPCALKMLKHRFIYDARVVEKFKRETDLLGRLSHPNIVAVNDSFVAFRTRFLVLERFDGSDLRNVLKQVGHPRWSTAKALLGQVAAGLSYVHGQGVLHLDLKPANVLVDRSGRVAITDFGLARLARTMADEKERVGTPYYMPPEQFAMEQVGPQSDWYSFACLAFEICTGQRLFHAESSQELQREKARVPSKDWPDRTNSSDWFESLVDGLQPDVHKRKMDLEAIAKWARPVPELFELSEAESDLT